MEDSRLQYSLNSEPFEAQGTTPHSADLRVHLLLLRFFSFVFSHRKAAIPNYELRKRAGTCCWLASKKKKKKASHPFLAYPP